MNKILIYLCSCLLLLSCEVNQKSEHEIKEVPELKITYSEALHKNNRNYPKPIEDFIVSDDSKNIFLVLDGVSRSKIDGLYPIPSPSATVAKIFGEEVYKKLLLGLDENNIQNALETAIIHGNNAIQKYNSKSTDWSFLPGVVGIVSLIKNDSFYYAYNGDCYGRLIRDGKTEQFTSPQTKLIHEHKSEFSADEIRNVICNNIAHPYSYGVFTGEAKAMDFVEYGKFKISPTDRIILSSDGLENLFNSENFNLLDSTPSNVIIQQAVYLESSNTSLGSDDKALIQIEIEQ